jgi:glycosyltransferase involved in cell wall biosynthesis
VPEPLTIAQVTPYPWEDEHEVNAFVRALAAEQAASGHQVVVLAPSHDPDLVRESRRRIRAGDLYDPDGGVRVLGVGELLPLAGARRGTMPALPLDISRTIEEALTVAPPEFVHVHEPFAPSASSVALRHSRSLNVGTFHAPAERVLSTQVARRFVELFFGRLDARSASFEATRELMQRVFPAEYRVLRPGATPIARPSYDGPLRIAFVDQEERAALRLFLRALRRLDPGLDWEATVFVPSGAAPTIRSQLLDRVQVLSERDTSEDAVLGAADVVVAASHGVLPSPGLLVRALGAGAVPVAAHLGSYEEVICRDDDLGLLFEAGDVDTLAAQLERLIRDDGLLSGLRASAQRAHDDFDWARVAQGFQALYEEVAARRHPATGNAEVAARLADRPLIDVDLHMHTDHSSDCATPVEVLLATARDAGLGAIAVTDHNEISGAHDARAKAAEFGVKVIVAEEVKTADQGEVIGLFIEEKIPRGMTLEETIAEIKRQGGLVYVPHPFDRLHSVPDYEHLLAVVEDIDALEVFNARVAIAAFNEEAVRFAAKYRIVGGAGSDAHVPQGLGSVRIRMRDFDGPEEFLESLRDADIVRKPQSLLYVQALKFLQTKATPPGARRAARQRRVRKVARNQ